MGERSSSGQPSGSPRSCQSEQRDQGHEDVDEIELERGPAGSREPRRAAATSPPCRGDEEPLSGQVSRVLLVARASRGSSPSGLRSCTRRRDSAAEGREHRLGEGGRGVLHAGRRGARSRSPTSARCATSRPRRSSAAQERERARRAPGATTATRVIAASGPDGRRPATEGETAELRRRGRHEPDAACRPDADRDAEAERRGASERASRGPASCAVARPPRCAARPGRRRRRPSRSRRPRDRR